MALDTRTAVPGAEVVASHGEVTKTLRRLIAECVASEAGLNHAAEHAQQRGLKLLLKAFAQQRAVYARELQQLLAAIEAEDEPPAAPAPAGEIYRGVSDIAAAMAVPRVEREQVALREQVEAERRLLEAYAATLATTGLPKPVSAVVERQRNQVAAVYDRLEALSAEGGTILVARLFERGRQADQAIGQLRAQGVRADEIQVFDVDQLPVHAETPAVQRKSMRSTVLGGALAGGIVGGLVGLAVALYQMLMPNQALQISVDPVTMVVSSAIFGLLIAAVFGWIIGRNKVEDDAFVYADSLVRGQKLVAVYIDEPRRAADEKTLRIHHERELDGV
jgi:uncharacterized protein (TIGR02284 family)